MSANGKVCPICMIELRPKKNGVCAVEMSVQGAEALWQADLWHCPMCQLEVLLGFSKTPSVIEANRIALDLQNLRAKNERIIPFWLNAIERAQTSPDVIVQPHPEACPVGGVVPRLIALIEAFIQYDDDHKCRLCGRDEWGNSAHDDDCPYLEAYKLLNELTGRPIWNPPREN